jgi:hypothetical protein
MQLITQIKMCSNENYLAQVVICLIWLLFTIVWNKEML